MAGTVLTYRTSSGAEPATEYVAGLTGLPKVRAAALIHLLAEMGNNLRQPRSKAGFLSYAISRPAVRIFYVFLPGRHVALLDGITKKRADLPASLLARLREMHRAVKAEFHKGGRT